MGQRPDSALADDFNAAMEWWRGAGVDCVFNDEPTRWIAPPAAAESELPKQHAPDDTSPVPAAGPPAASVWDRSAWPQDLGDFAQWWLTDPLLDGGRTTGRVPPRGERGAKLMIVVPEPERDDRETLLSGLQGKLLDAMLSAMGLSPQDTYLASALPRHTPVADWAAAAKQGIGDALAHHIKLVQPQRILAFGGNILPLFGNDLPNSGDDSRIFNHEGLSIPLLPAMDLAVLLVRPRAKGRLWQMWLDWTGIMSE